MMLGGYHFSLKFACLFGSTQLLGVQLVNKTLDVELFLLTEEVQLFAGSLNIFLKTLPL